MDEGLRLQLLHAAYADRVFLKASASHFQSEFFPNREEKLVAQAELTYWDKYEEPIGPLLRSDCEELAVNQKFNDKEKQRLKDLLDRIVGGKVKLVSVAALKDKLKRLKYVSFYEHAVDEIIEAHDKDELDAQYLAELVEKAKRELGDKMLASRDYFDPKGLEMRIIRRSKVETTRAPKLLIDQLDKKVRMVSRGHLGLFLAPYASGKGHALLHVARAYAMQGLNVLFFTLEDPIDEVENRLDASIAGLPKNRLSELPNKLKKRFRRAQKMIRGRINLVDATEGGWTVTRFRQAWEEHRQQGFIADAVIIDYDDEIEPEEKYKGDSAPRMRTADVYRRLRKMAASLNIIVWTAAQATRAAENKPLLTGRDVAEDIGKIRKASLGIGIGGTNDEPNIKWLSVLRHRLDRSRFAVEIRSDFSRGLFYDRDATLEIIKRRKSFAQR